MAGQVKKHPGLQQPRCRGEPEVGTQGHGAGPPTSQASPPALHPPRNSLGFTRSAVAAGAGFRSACPARAFWAAAVGPAEGNAAMSIKGKPIRKQRPRRRRSLSLREQVSRQRPPGIHLGSAWDGGSAHPAGCPPQSRLTDPAARARGAREP